MVKKSAGILLYRLNNNLPEVLLAHPGGPFWAKKDAGVWTIPKGEFTEEEDPLKAAKREFKEETGIEVSGKFIPLTPLKQKSGKIIYAWMLEANLDPTQIISNTFELEWPPKSGVIKQFPEIDKAEWFSIKEAKEKISQGQLEFIKQLEQQLSSTRKTDKLVK